VKLTTRSVDEVGWPACWLRLLPARVHAVGRHGNRAARLPSGWTQRLRKGSE